MHTNSLYTTIRDYEMRVVEPALGENLLNRKSKPLTIVKDEPRHLGAAEVANLAREAIRESIS